MQHNFPFDPTYGYTLDKLLGVGSPPGPGDIDLFWRQTYSLCRAIPLNLSMRPIKSASPDLELYEVEYDSLDNVRVGAWLTVPKDRRFSRGIVFGHGYGGREGPDLRPPGLPAACIFPCARGFNRSRSERFSDNSARHVRQGIESRETYIHRGCVADFWAGATALLELFPQIAGNLDYIGGSFGGGIGALLLPWDDRFRRAFLDVPSFGNYPLRLTLQCVGSGESIRQLSQKRDVLPVLQYFDAATAARFIRIPTLVAAAVFDPAVPPPGQFAVYNAIPGEKDLFVRAAAHFDWPGGPAEDARLHQALNRWFA